MTFTIGQVATGAGVNVQTVRYYERRGLLPKAHRTPSGYRQYEADSVARLRFIKRAQDLGFSLEDVRDLLALRLKHAAACGAVEAKARKKIAVVETKIQELERMRDALEGLVAACDTRTPTGDCPILAALDQDDR